MRNAGLAVAAMVLLAGCGGGSASEETRSAERMASASTPRVTTTEGMEDAGTGNGPLRLERVATGLDSPLALVAAPGQPGRLYVVEQPGRVVVLEDERALDRPFLDVSDDVVSGGEQGLLGLAFHPDYEENGLLYVHYTNRDGDTRVVEYRAGDGAVNESSARTILEVDQPYGNHNGGQLAFAPDGRLWVGLGDGGAGGDPENRAQNLDSPLGKLLALDVEARSPEAEVVAYGLRNPWRFSFDRETDDLWIADVGQNEFEEVNRLESERVGDPVNFGWRVFEGRSRYTDEEPSPEGDLVEPVLVYDHSEGCSVTGGYVYRGDAIPRLQGRYVYGDYCSGRVWTLDPGSGEAREAPFTVEALSSFGQDLAGELYLVSLAGDVFRLTAP